jgi:hypothetical protein
MSIPDFVRQVQDIEQRLKSEWQTVQQGWQDSVAEGFDSGVMVPYMRNFQQYVTGEGISGYGLEQLLQQMDTHLQQMDSLTN